MKSFHSFLNEQTEPEGRKLKHLTHLEDHPIHGGHEGANLAVKHLEDVHKAMQGGHSTTSISTKYDGAPSIVFGRHPQTGKFFVASKSAFNKTPKINYTPQDIERNHGHAPGLVQKLKAALEHLPKIMPKTGGVYQGDVMHTRSDIRKSGGMVHFTPNTITYSTPHNSPQGKQIRNSKFGIVVHTRYSGARTLESMSASPLDNKTRSQFVHDPDVHNIDPTIKVEPSHYSLKDRTEFMKHQEAAQAATAKTKPEDLSALQGHGASLEAHINQMVKQGKKPSTEGYIQHLMDRHSKEIEKVKTQAAKDRKTKQFAAMIQHVRRNKKHFDRALQIHHHLQQGKNVLTRVMARHTPFQHSIGGAATGPEGAVAVDKQGNMSKFVDRDEFSRQNFLTGKMQQMKKEPTNA